MRLVIQRVNWAKVESEGECLGEIKKGLVVFVGVSKWDSRQDVDYLARKVVTLRVFEDDTGKMNLSILDINGKMLIISQFTLYGDLRRGRRPCFTEAACQEEAKELYDDFLKKVKSYGVEITTGRFGARMEVLIHNDGPVTFVLESNHYKGA